MSVLLLSDLFIFKFLFLFEWSLISSGINHIFLFIKISVNTSDMNQKANRKNVCDIGMVPVNNLLVALESLGVTFDCLF